MEISDKTQLLSVARARPKPAAQPLFDRVVLVGTGVIGGSLGRDIRRLRLAREVIAYGPDPDILQRSMMVGAIDRYTTEADKAMEGADLVMLAVPLGAFETVLRHICPHLGPDTIVSDAGSAKMCAIEAVAKVTGAVPPWFVPGHPIAGKERSGPEAAEEGLYAKHRVILTPTPETDIGAVRRVGELWSAVGAEVLTMRPERHDEVLAATSHLPHLLAFALVDMLGGMEERAEIFRYAAGGFRDFTRIASSDPTMWHDICIANDKSINVVLRAFAEQVEGLIEAIDSGDSEHLKGVFERAKARRDRYTQESRQGI